MKRVPAKQRNSRVHRERDTRALSRLALLLVFGLFLAGGFVFAARQHFTAIDYGYKNEDLRRERARLLEEKQQLTLKREQAFAPARLAVLAREQGLKPLEASQVGTQKPSQVGTQKPSQVGTETPRRVATEKPSPVGTQKAGSRSQPLLASALRKPSASLQR
jgi:hypothetical protein